MNTSIKPRLARVSASGVGFCLLVSVVALQSLAQDAAQPETGVPVPATISDDAVRTEGEAAPPVDLHTLLQREQQRLRAGGVNTGKARVSIHGMRDGTTEVRSAEGEVLGRYPAKFFSYSSRGSTEAIERLNAEREARKEKFAERKKLKQEESEKAMEAAKEKEALEKERAEEEDARWNDDFASKAGEYLDRRSGENLKAVKIDAREIRDDGTLLYEGKEFKPARLWNTRRKQFEMAIPLKTP